MKKQKHQAAPAQAEPKPKEFKPTTTAVQYESGDLVIGCGQCGHGWKLGGKESKDADPGGGGVTCPNCGAVVI